MHPTEIAALCETYRAHLALGNEVVDGAGCLAIRNDDARQVYDANLVWVGPDSDVESAFAFADAQFAERDYRNLLIDPFSPPPLAAELALRGFVPDPTLQLLLSGPLAGPKPEPFEIRPVESEGDWLALQKLFRADHIETDQKHGTSLFSEELTSQIVETHRKAARDAHFFQAWIDGEAVAFFSSWPGRNGTGMVEDLFTLPSHRRRGIARALIHHCVEDARARGAQQVLIGAEPGDTPKDLYAALGFEPACLTTCWRLTQKTAPAS